MDINFKTRYQKSKFKVKVWETKFKSLYGRVPSKHDIHEADVGIREAYKTYFKLKSAVLEETLMDITFDDTESCNTDGLEPVNGLNLDKSNSIINIIEPTGSDFNKSDEYTSTSQTIKYPEDMVIKSFESHESTDQLSAQNVWGSHLNKTKPTKKKDVPSVKLANATYCQKLFKHSSFSKRNPRKSLSSNKSFNRSDSEVSFGMSQPYSQTDSQSINEMLPDLDNIMQMNAEYHINNPIVPLGHPKYNTHQSKAKPLRAIDHGWLDRCNLMNNLVADKVVENDSGLGSLESSILLTESAETDVGSQSSEIAVHSSSDLQEPPNQVTYGLSNLDFTRYALPSVEKHFDPSNYSDSDEIVGNSESESEFNDRNISRIKHIIKKRKVLDNCLNSSAFDSGIITNGMAGGSLVNKNDNFDKTVVKNNVDLMTVPGNTNEVIIEKRFPKRSVKTGNKLKLIKHKSDSEDGNNTTDKVSTRPKRNYKIRKYQVVEHDENEDPFHSDDDHCKDPDFINDADMRPDPLQNVVHEEYVELEKPKRKSKMTNINKTGKVKHVAKGPAPAKAPKLGRAKTSATVRKKKKVANIDLDEERPEQQKYDLEFSLNPSEPTVSRLGIGTLPPESSSGDLVEAFASAVTSPAVADVESAVRKRKVVTRLTDKEKLQKKVAAGNLNENFVTINLRKKVFVRGKKTVNYSKYKKSQWKAKKAAALTGPEMDMGGCDGGTLTCYKCGLAGHFARRCKADIGDNLLPLDADIDVSPFPTLEEATNMAARSVLLVHSQNPEKLPPATKYLENENTKYAEPNNQYKDNSVVIRRDPITAENASVESAEHDEPVTLADLTNTVAVSAGVISQSSKSETPWRRYRIPDALLKDHLATTAGDGTQVEPLYKTNPDGSLIKTPDEVFTILKMFGHEKFRPGQEKAIMRILSGKSTLVTLSTGSGKSLCYQLPAYLYAQARQCITLVISPLVSLMEDQVTGVPDFLHASCLHTNQTPVQREKILQAIRGGMMNILLVSPEAVVSGEKQSGFGSLLRSLPPIAFACIDEAHCVSQWSHNFRPSYLMICRVLREKLGVTTVLGLTATATRQTRESIVSHLCLPDGLNGVISDTPLPNNLQLTVSKDANRDRALITLLKGERFSACNSIIVYCTRRDECERLAGFIRTCLQGETVPDGIKKRKRICWNAEPYHAGMVASRRKSVQNAFMAGELRIVVATVAFGMGINKSDIRAVIHYNMPKTFESYVQEVGRAGRDGLPAHCHLFLDSHGGDLNELRRHIYSNAIDRHVIRKLLQRVFVPCQCAKSKPLPNQSNLTPDELGEIELLKEIDWSKQINEDSINDTVDNMKTITPVSGVNGKRICPGHEVAFSVMETVEALDIPEENISTLLCYLELHNERYINVLSLAYTTAKITSYGGPKRLRLAAQSCPPLAMAIALDLKQGISHDNSSQLEFAVIDVAAAIGWDSGVVKRQLKNLEWTIVNGRSKRSNINVEFLNLGFRVRAPGDLTDKELDETLDLLFNRVSVQERTALLQLQAVCDAMSSVAFDSCDPCAVLDVSPKRSETLKVIIREYFQREKTVSTDEPIVEEILDSCSEAQIISDVRSMVANYPENNFTGRAIARIFHGIQSPNYPAVIWFRCRYWRSHLVSNFHTLARIANREIIRLK